MVCVYVDKENLDVKPHHGQQIIVRDQVVSNKNGHTV